MEALRTRLVGVLVGTCVVALGLLVCVSTARAEDDASKVPAPAHVDVPSLQGYSLAQARAVLKRRGLEVGTVYGMSRERIYAYLTKHYPAFPNPLEYAKTSRYQRVFVHSPRSRERVPVGATIDIILCSRGDGPLPPDPRFTDLKVLALPRETSGGDEPAPAPTATEPTAPPKRPDPVPSPADESLPDPTVKGAPDPVVADAPDPAPTRPVEVPTSVGADRIADGSPDAPRAAPEADRNTVPALVGLDLTDAEQLARDADMMLYVERVAGHPVGRVLEQTPDAGSAREAGGVVKVIITAGGDFDAALPDAPAVHVGHVDMPELLDRTEPQAQRILHDLGLRAVSVPAERGLPGRVVDQKPGVGDRVAKGSEVQIFIGPGERRVGPDGPSIRASAPRAPASAGGTPKGFAPKPIAPAAGTELPADETIPMGFTWRAVEGAEAYILEIEEQAADGTWIAGARKRAKTTAVMVEMERLDVRTPRAFRWRVRVVSGGKTGAACDWVVLK